MRSRSGSPGLVLVAVALAASLMLFAGTLARTSIAGAQIPPEATPTPRAVTADHDEMHRLMDACNSAMPSHATDQPDGMMGRTMGEHMQRMSETTVRQ